MLSIGDEIYADRIEAVRNAGLPIDIRLAQVASRRLIGLGAPVAVMPGGSKGSGGDRRGSVTDLTANAPTDPAALLFSSRNRAFSAASGLSPSFRGAIVRLLNGDWIYSASDLTGFAACEHLTQLDGAPRGGEIERPKRNDPLLDVLSRRGDEHEAKIRADHGGTAMQIVDIDVPAGLP